MSRDRRITRLDDLPANWAELLYKIGRRVRKHVRRGAGLEEVSRRLRSTIDYCELALEFASSSDRVKLRAMVEDWSLDRIVQELGRAQPIWAMPHMDSVA